VPFPTVVITPIRNHADAVVLPVGDIQVARGVRGDAFGFVQFGAVAGPLSPLKPVIPFPATVVITPFETLRMRLLPDSTDVHVARQSRLHAVG